MNYSIFIQNNTIFISELFPNEAEWIKKKLVNNNIEANYQHSKGHWFQYVTINNANVELLNKVKFIINN